MGWFDTASVKCPSCGAGLQVKRDSDSARCEYCGTTSVVRHRGAKRPIPAAQARMPVIEVATPRFLGLIITLFVVVPILSTVIGAGFAIWRAVNSVTGQFNDAMGQAGDAFGKAGKTLDRANETIERATVREAPTRPTKIGPKPPPKRKIGRYVLDPAQVPKMVRENVEGPFKLRWLDIAQSGARAKVDQDGTQTTVRLMNDGEVQRYHKEDSNDPLFELDQIDFEQAEKIFAKAPALVGNDTVMVAAVFGKRDGKLGWEVLLRNGDDWLTVHYRSDGVRLGWPKKRAPKKPSPDEGPDDPSASRSGGRLGGGRG